MNKCIVSLFMLGTTLGYAPIGYTAAEVQKAAMSINITASLVEKDKKAKDKTATVEVQAAGIQILDPDMASKDNDNAKANEKGKDEKQAHFHYRLDNGATIATTATKLSFHGLSSGTHRIEVSLADNEHRPLGPKQELTVTIP